MELAWLDGRLRLWRTLIPIPGLCQRNFGRGYRSSQRSCHRQGSTIMEKRFGTKWKGLIASEQRLGPPIPT